MRKMKRLLYTTYKIFLICNMYVTNIFYPTRHLSQVIESTAMTVEILRTNIKILQTYLFKEIAND